MFSFKETQFNGIQQQEEEDVSNGHVSSIEGKKPLEPLGVEEVFNRIYIEINYLWTKFQEHH